MFLSLLSTFALATVREIEIRTEKIGEAIHWAPAKVPVKTGEKVKFLVKHDVEGGFDFHGFFIPVLKIAKQVDRHKPLEMEVQIPKDLKPGQYDIGCQFHPKHVAAKLVVEK